MKAYTVTTQSTLGERMVRPFQVQTTSNIAGADGTRQADRSLGEGRGWQKPGAFAADSWGCCDIVGCEDKGNGEEHCHIGKVGSKGEGAGRRHAEELWGYRTYVWMMCGLI